jgi:hypothetical protein
VLQHRGRRRRLGGPQDLDPTVAPAGRIQGVEMLLRYLTDVRRLPAPDMDDPNAFASATVAGLIRTPPR